MLLLTDDRSLAIKVHPTPASMPRATPSSHLDSRAHPLRIPKYTFSFY